MKKIKNRILHLKLYVSGLISTSPDFLFGKREILCFSGVSFIGRIQFWTWMFYHVWYIYYLDIFENKNLGF